MARSVRRIARPLNPRTWTRPYGDGTGLVVGAVVFAVSVAVFAVLLWHADWVAGNLRGLTPSQRVTAVDDARGRLIQLGAGVLAAGALIFTALNYVLSREGHVTDRYTKAIEQLGSERLHVRLGGIYALERIMIDSPRDHPTIVEVLAAFVREHSPMSDGQRSASPDRGTTISVPQPATDVQAAVTVLGRRPAGREERGSLDLHATDLRGLDLSDANLKGATLTQATLVLANLTGADLSEASLFGTDLSGAVLTYANLVNAHLRQADLSGAYLGPQT